MLLRRTLSLPMCAALALSGCNAIIGIESPLPLETGGAGGRASSASTAIATNASTAASVTAASSTSTGPLCANEIPFDYPATRDGILVGGPPPACKGAISYADSDFANIGIGHGVFHFDIDPDVASAFTDNRIDVLKLTLWRVTTSACPGGCMAPGTLHVFPLRNDWEEGVPNMQYQGADWCRRLSGNPPAGEWEQMGAYGPSDTGIEAGSFPVANADMQIDIPLLPMPLASKTSGGLSVIVRPDATLNFLASTHERTDGTPPAHLHGVYCAQ